MEFVLAVLCFIFGSLFVGSCSVAISKKQHGAFGLCFMTSLIIIALMLKLIF